jgi:hypothetical protein
MKKTMLPLLMALGILLLMVPGSLSQSSEGSDVTVDVDTQCDVSIYNFQQPGQGGEDPLIIGKGATDYFSGTVSNTGNQNATIDFDLNVYSVEDDGSLNETDVSDQPGNYTYNFSLPSTTFSENDTEFRDFISEFNATYAPGSYIGALELNYSCENGGGKTNATRPFEVIEATGIGEGNRPDDTGQEDDVDLNLDTDAVVEALKKNSSLRNNVTEQLNSSLNTDALIEELERIANVSTNISEQELANLSSDALVEALNKTGQIDTDVNRTENASLETDADQTAEDAQPKEGSGDFPGQTPEPQPQPTPDPVPLLSVTMRPLNATYEATRGEFTEVGMEINNTGEEAISNLEMDPRFSEDMDWESQSLSIESLEVGETVERSVYVNPGASVDPGMYQIPVYASNPDNDIGSQFVNVEVTEEPVSISALNISEAPQDIRFETNKNYTVPVLLRNAGDEAMENVDIELQNSENCGNYAAETVESIAAGETASVSVTFEAAQQLEECEATIVASSDSGSFAFSELTVETVESKGIVPQEFRVPIVASLWTVMLIVYTVVTKRYGLNSLTVKIPLIILVAGEAFILIYLSSAYYNVIPPGILPFETAAT